MYYQIQNPCISLVVSSKGAEMHSIKDAAGQEYLWQGDKNSWPDQAINLFPWVARLTQGKYTYGGESYFMESHGFTAASEFSCVCENNDEMVFTLTENSETLKKYPFRFVFSIGYRLEGKTIQITFRVKNTDDKKLYFGMGGHPGFIVPMDGGAAFDDYVLKFSAPCTPYRVGMSDDCFVTGKDEIFPLDNQDTLPLKQGLFDNDAIILRDMAQEVTLCGPGEKKITVSYPGFTYLGIWNWPRQDVNYVCIEPWTSLPARKDVVEDLCQKPDLLSLEPGGVCERKWSISL